MFSGKSVQYFTTKSNKLFICINKVTTTHRRVTLFLFLLFDQSILLCTVQCTVYVQSHLDCGIVGRSWMFTLQSKHAFNFDCYELLHSFAPSMNEQYLEKFPIWRLLWKELPLTIVCALTHTTKKILKIHCAYCDFISFRIFLCSC